VRFTVRADRQLIRAGARSRRFLCAEILAPEAPSRPGRLPVNLAFVLDRSGSMEGATPRPAPSPASPRGTRPISRADGGAAASRWPSSCRPRRWVVAFS
jgi:hypothetical protein